jgi:indolepyruvate ferredoxin oxidoreductase, beta subunit
MSQPLRILLAALGGEGGGVLMNWVVAAARNAGHVVQATSVPGVAQRTGSTSYYIEIAPLGEKNAVLGLVPMPCRVDVVVSSELVETARALAFGFVTSDRTTLISSTARFYSNTEKMALGDGRFNADDVTATANELAKTAHMHDLAKIATDNGTFVSATMFGALAGANVLPWDMAHSRSVLGDIRSEAGFDAAAAAVRGPSAPVEKFPEQITPLKILEQLPNSLANVIAHGIDRCEDFQDAEYGQTFLTRTRSLVDIADLNDHRSLHAVTEACRRLALWMTYEDICRVADLKTRTERFARIADEAKLAPGQVLKVTDYLKPRAEEIADILPVTLGRRLMKRVERGAYIPFVGTGIRLQSNGVLGFYLLRFSAYLARFRRRSYRFAEEDAAIEDWLELMHKALPRDAGFALALGELPRVLKGYSDTLIRGKRAYREILESIVRPSIEQGQESAMASTLTRAIGEALADEDHKALSKTLSDQPAIPNLKEPLHV